MSTIADCQHEKTRVINSRTDKTIASALVYRRRECEHCGLRFSTYEIPVNDYRALVAKTNRLDKLVKNIQATISDDK